MIPPVRYRAPESIAAAITLLSDEPEPVIVGGGTWVLPQLHRRERSASAIIDLRRVGLDDVRLAEGRLRIGATVTYSTLAADELVATRAPLLARMAAQITGGVQVRNQGTIGGSACYATPSSDVPGCLVALDAELELHGPGGARHVPAADFFTGAQETARNDDELLVAISVAADSRPWAYEKLKLSESSWPIATVAGTASPGGSVTLTLGAVSATPLRLKPRSEAEIPELLDAALVAPWDDVLAPADYRRRVAPAIARRAWRRLETVTGTDNGDHDD